MRGTTTPMPEASFIAPDLFRPKLTTWPFGALTPCGYDLIWMDAPWLFELYSERGEEKSAQAQYPCMSLEDIATLPVSDLAKPDCLMVFWATAPMLDQQIDVMARLGFTYKTHGVWVKTTKDGNGLAFGTGYVLRNCHEVFLIGKRGNPQTDSKSIRSVIMAPRREHSRKPDAAYDMAEAMMPRARRCELFSRETRPGWDVWGNEAGKFDSDQQLELEEAHGGT